MTPTQTRLSCALIWQPARVSGSRGSGAAGSGGRGLGSFLGAVLRPGLRGRFDRGLARRRLLDPAGVAEEFPHSLGRLCPDAEPMADALFLQGHAIGVIALQ